MAKYVLTPDFLKSQIDNVTFNRFGEAGIQCVITLRNGYTVTGESGCIDPTIFDRSIGETIAYENAFDKLWAILGYNEKQRWYEETVLTWLDRVKLELEDLDKKRTKLADMLAKGKSEFISTEEWERLNKQAEVMSAYAFILQERITAAFILQERITANLSEDLTYALGDGNAHEIVGLWEDEPKTQMGLKLSNALYEKYGVTYREVYIGCCPVCVFDTDVFAKVHGVLLYDGENIFAVPSYIFETFKKLGN